jgi:hypothetical protein
MSVSQFIQRRDREWADSFDELRLSTERATAMVCAAIAVRNPFRTEATERDSKSATFISLQVLT